MRRFHLPYKNWRTLSDDDLGGKRENTVCLVRYGGYGDAIQISSVIAAFKKQGKRVCVNATEHTQLMLRHDPNVDELFCQKTDQIPNKDLGPFWERLEDLFDQVITFAHVIEGNLLSLPSRKTYTMSHEKRHKKLNINYSEALHDHAGVPHKFNQKFYTGSSERKWVKSQRRDMRLGSNHFVIVVALSGSSVHKAYPHMDAVIAQCLMKWPFVRFVLIGEPACELLEIGWEKEPRVFLRSGKWGVRKAIAFAQSADLVVGPETGVLNAVSMDDMAKVCLLSHSSHENLTKHWVNTTSVEPEGVGCFPCHKMHMQGFKTCNRDQETGGALCAAKINPSSVVDAIEYHWKLMNEFSGTVSNR